MQFKPIGKRLLLQREEQVTQTKSGILLASSNNEKPSYGKIVAIGSDLTTNSDLKLGVMVAFKEYKTNEIKINNIEYLVVEYEDVLGVITN